MCTLTDFGIFQTLFENHAQFRPLPLLNSEGTFIYTLHYSASAVPNRLQLEPFSNLFSSIFRKMVKKWGGNVQ